MFTHRRSNRQPPDGAEGVHQGAIASKRSMACVTTAFRRSRWRCIIPMCDATRCGGCSPRLPACSGDSSTGTTGASGRIMAAPTHNALRHRMSRVDRLHLTARLIGVLVTEGLGTHRRQVSFGQYAVTCRNRRVLRLRVPVLSTAAPVAHSNSERPSPRRRRVSPSAARNSQECARSSSLCDLRRRAGSFS